MTLHLDARQRAMLAEMHVRVWSPLDESAAVAPLAVEPVTVTTAVAVPVADVTPNTEVRTAHVVPPPVASQIVIQRPEGIDQMDWATLQTTVSQCHACTLCSTRQHTVFGVGAPAEPGKAPQVDWLIVGEAPGEHEDLQGEPFVGQAGKLLDNMLLACGLSRTGARGPAGGGVYIANVLKCRPPGNRNPRPEEVAQCQPFLQRQVELLQPKIIVAMGRFAAQSLLQGSVPEVDNTPLGKLRGQVYRYQGVPVVVTYHPAYLLRNLPEKAKVWADLCLAMAQRQAQA